MLAFLVAILVVGVALQYLHSKRKEKIWDKYIISGFVSRGFEEVEHVFRQQFVDGEEEHGAAFAAYYKGYLVVDLWGGYADRDSLYEWKEDTMTNLFSVTKGIGALCMAVLVDRGRIKYDDLVIQYWPEFGRYGKSHVTVQMLMAHQAGVPLLDVELDMKTLADRRKMGEILSGQKPFWIPSSSTHGYHIFTHGALVDQLVWKVDPEGRTLGQFFREEIAEKFGIDVHVGLPKQLNYRVARLAFCNRMLSDWIAWIITRLMEFLLPNSISLFRQFLDKPNPRLFGLIGNGMFNNVDFRSLEFPSANGIGLARGLAKLYGILANGGTHGGHVLLSSDILQQIQRKVTSGKDKVVGYLPGLFKPQFTAGGFYTGAPFTGPQGKPTFGCPGYGGQAAFADPANQLGWAYLTNGIRQRDVDGRSLKMMTSLYHCLAKLQK